MSGLRRSASTVSWGRRPCRRACARPPSGPRTIVERQTFRARLGSAAQSGFCPSDQPGRIPGERAVWPCCVETQICVSCGRPVGERNRHVRFQWPDPVLQKWGPEGDPEAWMTGPTANESVMMQVNGVGVFVRALLPVGLSGGYSVTFGVWVTIDHSKSHHVPDLGEHLKWGLRHCHLQGLGRSLSGLIGQQSPPRERPSLCVSESGVLVGPFVWFARACVRGTRSSKKAREAAGSADAAGDSCLIGAHDRHVCGCRTPRARRRRRARGSCQEPRRRTGSRSGLAPRTPRAAIARSRSAGSSTRP